MADLEGRNGQRKEFKVVGKPNLPGKLSYAQATGTVKFGIDYVFPGMLHAKFLRSPYANAKVSSVDTTRTMQIPGVVDIFTWEDEDGKYRPMLWIFVKGEMRIHRSFAPNLRENRMAVLECGLTTIPQKKAMFRTLT